MDNMSGLHDRLSNESATPSPEKGCMALGPRLRFLSRAVKWSGERTSLQVITSREAMMQSREFPIHHGLTRPNSPNFAKVSFSAWSDAAAQIPPVS